MPELGPAPSSVYAPPETRNEVERPTASPAASHPSAAMLPFHLCDSHFPNDPWPHISLKEARCCFQPVPTAHFCPLFKGPLFHHSLCPLLPSGGNSVTHIAWNEDHRPSLYKLLIENHVRNGRKRRGGGGQQPLTEPLILWTATHASRRAGLVPSQPHKSFLPATGLEDGGSGRQCPPNQKGLQGCS